MGKTNRVFAARKFLVAGRSEAENEAVEVAKAFYAELVPTRAGQVSWR